MQFKELLKPGKIHSILCVGNLCSKSVLDYLRSIASDVTLVQGDFDEFTSPEYTVVTRGDFRIGLIHGHQVVPAGERASLSLLHRQLGVDILVTGHTHEHKVGFVLLDVDGPKATVYMYQLQAGKVKVDRIDYVKPPSPAARAS
ncbi:vacuolar protein sorting-associated protein 29 [Haematococcus lacustris]|uniref:Vacuolar protein sorting-associated protein 29 n=1 Tax=Haematococcus lacustris TaxID=44745 RepID=A0A6A0AH07_HAELA|nr:vacuolar protein sorting-associated protein 29 [Haematococcus lacustris]